MVYNNPVIKSQVFLYEMMSEKNDIMLVNRLNERD